MTHVLSYTIDAGDRLSGADAGYFSFAEQNSWGGAEESIGRPLWDFVDGATVQKVQRSLVRAVRTGGRTVELPFRCDAPDLLREMALVIEPWGPHGSVRFSAHLLSERIRPVATLLEPGRPRGRGAIEMCAWCDRFRVGRCWLEVEAASRVLGLTEAGELPPITHGLCGRCAGNLAGA